MPESLHIMVGQRFAAPGTLEHCQDFSIVRGCGDKVKHGFIPNGKLRAWGITALSPRMVFTFNEGGRLCAAKVELVRFANGTHPDIDRKIPFEMKPGMTKKPTDDVLEVRASCWVLCVSHVYVDLPNALGQRWL